MHFNFIVIKYKKIAYFFIFLVSICLITSTTNTLIETSNSNRLLPIYSVDTNKQIVSLTFDCAWGANDIPEIINILTNNNVKATFFTVGDWIKRYPDAIKTLYDAGMEIGNHSDSHAHVNKLSYEENRDDMIRCNEKITALTGSNVKFYRGPYGEYNNTVINVAKELGMKVIQWDIDTLDYE